MVELAGGLEEKAVAGHRINVVPGIGGEERANLGSAKRDEQAEHAAGGGNGGDEGQVRLDGRHAVRRPQVGEIGLDDVSVAREEQANDDQGDKGKRFGGSEDVLDELADSKAARVDVGQQDNDEEGDELRA